MILFLVFILMPPNLFFFWAARYFFLPSAYLFLETYRRRLLFFSCACSHAMAKRREHVL